MKNISLNIRKAFIVIRYFLLISLIILGLNVQVQSQNVNGVVATAASPVQNASVTFIADSDTTNKLTAITDISGNYQINFVTTLEPGLKPLSNFKLDQNFPNPFSASTAISYKLNRQTDVWITIYDVLGREVKKFTMGLQPGGINGVVWDGKNNLGEKVAPGVYFYQLKVKGEMQVKKMLFFPGLNTFGDIRPGIIAKLASGPDHISKVNNLQQVNYSVLIENTANTFPVIVPVRFENIAIQNDTTINFTVDEYIENLATIHLDSIRQIIRGFGASNIVGWRPDMTADQINLAFGTEPGQIGFTILRLRVPYDSNQFNLQVPTARSAAAQGAIIIAAPWTPPAWMKSNKNTVGGRLEDTSYAHFANHLASFADYMAANDAPLYAVSVQNEPDVNVTYESCDWNAAEMLRFARENAPSVGIDVMVPESYHFDHSLSDPILNDSQATANVAMIAGHLYGGGLVPYPLAQSKGKELWMTEYLDTDTTWSHVLATGKQINDCMVAGMSAYVWWYIVRFYGPILENGNVSKRGYVMSQFARFIRPGYFRVDATENPRSQIYLSAYKDNTKVVIIAINNGAQSVDQTFMLKEGTVTGFTPYVTSNIEKCVQQSDIAVTNSTFSATLKPSSITTFVSQE
jgi:glucuronoarabinoxylan endo-1,4-beta-xylanase